MSISEFFKNAVDAFKTIKYRRETEKVLETKFYALSSGLVGTTLGLIVGIIVLVIQLGFPAFDDSVYMSVLIGAALLALLAFAVWLIYPIVLDKPTPIMEKLITVSIVLILSIAGFLLGIYGLFIVLAAVICYFFIRILLPMLFKNS